MYAIIFFENDIIIIKLVNDRIIQRPGLLSVPRVKYDLPYHLRVPIADLLQFLRTQLPAQAAPVLIQFIKTQKPHRAFGKPEPLRPDGQRKFAGGVPLGKGRTGKNGCFAA